jgi:hypothetical protein
MIACSGDGSNLPADAPPVLPGQDSGTGPCIVQSRFYANGETWWEHCNMCSCQAGQASCTTFECGEPNSDKSFSCAVSGDCIYGPKCGNECCGPGERCNGWACVCGNRMVVCGANETCRGEPAMCGAGCRDVDPFTQNLREMPTRIAGESAR